MKKIFQLKGEDWMKGLSVDDTLAVGGLFNQATNFNPFEKFGLMCPADAGARIGDATIVKPIRSLVSAYYGGAPYILGYGDDSSLYQITANGSAVTDISSSITSGTTTARGSIMWKNKFIYIKDTEARSWDLASTNAQILASLTTGMPHDPCIGADGNLYIPNGNKVARCVLETGTSGNTTSAYTLDTGFVVRQCLNDGQYLVILADTNANGSAGLFRCVVIFWDMVSGTPERIYDWYENQVYSMEMKDQVIEIHASDFIYVCNIATPVKPLYPVRGSTIKSCLNPSCIEYFRNANYWVSNGGGSLDIYARGYGFGAGKNILFQPFSLTTTSYIPTAFIPVTYDSANSFLFVASVDNGGINPRLYKFYFRGSEAGATKGTSTLRIASLPLSQPYKFEYAKIVLHSALASGESVSFQIKTQDGSVMVSDTVTFNTEGKQTYIFRPKPDSTTKDYTEEFGDIILTSVKATIERFELWATPIEAQTAKI